jgi:phospholipid-binding lipoprotein MlaA
MSKFFHFITLLCVLFTGAVYGEPKDEQDPYQNFNRHMYAFNEGLDKIVIKPLATIYQAITPNFLRTGITNIFKNIDTIPTIFNDVLQADSSDLSKDTWRFLINSTVGVGGFWDVAYHMNLPFHQEDFGLTLAKWGFKNSNYLVLPFFGPSTVRDTIGLPVDYGTSIYPYIDDTTSHSIYALSVINTRANLLNYDDVLKQAFDPYVAVKNGYLQRRNNAINLN